MYSQVHYDYEHKDKFKEIGTPIETHRVNSRKMTTRF